MTISSGDVVTLAALALTAVAPIAFVTIVALLRGYDIALSMRRPPRVSRGLRGGRRLGDDDDEG